MLRPLCPSKRAPTLFCCVVPPFDCTLVLCFAALPLPPIARITSTNSNDRRRSNSSRIDCAGARDATRSCTTQRRERPRVCWRASPSLACTSTACAVRSTRHRARRFSSSAACAGRSATTTRCAPRSLAPASISRSAPSSWRSTSSVARREVWQQATTKSSSALCCVRLLKRKFRSMRLVGFAYLRFETHEAALQAFRQLLGETAPLELGRTLSVTFFRRAMCVCVCVRVGFFVCACVVVVVVVVAVAVVLSV
jgi:hypothetical protein